MGTTLVNPSSTPNPMPQGNPPPAFVDASGRLTYQAFWLLQTMRNGTNVALNGTLATYSPAPNGGDNSVGINAAILAVIAVGGGALQLVGAADYPVTGPIVFPSGYNGVVIYGNGAVIVRAANMPVNQGVIDIQGAQDVKIYDLTIEGAVTVATGVNYSTFGGDPMYAPFLVNTSVWVHAGSTDITFDGCTIQHTGGYAVLSDTRVGANNQRIKISRCHFVNNRPFLFGTNDADLTYGSCLGGIFYSADCSTAANVGVTVGMLVADCSFERNTGNQVWGHCYGYYGFHSQIIVANNTFLDIGLDCLEVSCTIGGANIGNVGRRIGYVCTDDTSQSVPKYLTDANATFIDHAGSVANVSVVGNVCTSVCGGFSSLDGCSFATICNNSFRQPQPGEAFYVEDQIALVPAGVVYGFDCANTFGEVGGITEQGGAGLAITGNSLYGCSASSIIAVAVSQSKISDNDIWQPGNSTFPPILLGNQSTALYQQCYNNSITGNRIFWSPATPAPAIIESENWSGGSIPWTAGLYNWIEGNHIFDPLGNAYEFQKAPSTVSTTRRRISSQVSSLAAKSFADLVRMSLASGAGGYLSFLGTDGTENMRIDDLGNLTLPKEPLARANGGLGFQPAGVGFLRDGNPATDGELTGAVTTSGGFFTTLEAFGPGAGTYTTGAKITPTGNPGSITIDGSGRVAAISPAT